MLAPVCVFSGVLEGDADILLGVRLNGDGIIEPKAFALEGEMAERGDSMVSRYLVVPF